MDNFAYFTIFGIFSTGFSSAMFASLCKNDLRNMYK